MASEIKLPKLKENVEAVEVSEVLVAADEEVAKDQPLIVVNADKSNMEVPSPVAGKVVQMRVKVGDELKIGDVYCVIEGGNGEATPPKKEEKPAEGKKPPGKPAAAKNDEAGDAPRPRDIRKVAQDARPTAPPAKPAAPPPGVGRVVPAGPATRWLARKLGVDLRQVRGSGPNGRVTEDDVKGFFGGQAAGPAGPAAQAPPLPNFEEFGAVRREPLSRVRKLTAQKMSLSW